MSQHDRYISPFSTRYASDEMQYIFSDDNKFRTWRRLWVALARAEMEQGLTNITPDMVAELEAHVDDINYEVAIEREKLVRHDVMSHVYAYGQQCPKAAGIIHLGATSCYVGDNTDIIVMRQGLELVRKKLVGVLAKLAHFAKEYKDMPCMAYTHCQPAQPTTVGKRATLWANELVMDLAEIDHRLATLQLRGVKGTTGTQASFMELFKGDADKIRAVDASIAKEMGFDPKAVIPVSGQTYSRKVDAMVLNALAAFGAGRAMGIPAETAIEALKNYTPSGQRQKVVEHEGITMVEDCYNASPDSMRAAIKTLGRFPCDGRRIFVAADMLELGDIAEESHREIGALCVQEGIDLLLTWGPLAQYATRAAKAAGMEAHHFEEKEALTKYLTATAHRGDVIWCKASHGMALEEVIAAFYRDYHA